MFTVNTVQEIDRPIDRPDRTLKFKELDALRTAKGMSLRAWARAARVSESTIYKLRMGAKVPSEVMLARLRSLA